MVPGRAGSQGFVAGQGEFQIAAVTPSDHLQLDLSGVVVWFQIEVALDEAHL